MTKAQCGGGMPTSGRGRHIEREKIKINGLGMNSGFKGQSAPFRVDSRLGSRPKIVRAPQYPAPGTCSQPFKATITAIRRAVVPLGEAR